VGPNGSGKSNVIDAMLFVFGKRAKQLRLNKVSELIHNSTDFRNLQYARVEVHFHEIVDSTTDEEAFAPVPGSDFVIAREAYKNNTSKYFIDTKTSNFTEVTTLLKTHGVDLNNNRFLILQGEVEQISMMKPKAQNPGDEGLLEYLEDIIGTNQYVEPIEEKAKALEALNEQRGGQVNRLKLVEKERDALGGAKAEAETFMAKEREVAAAKSVLFQKRAADARLEMARVSAESESLRLKLEQEKSKYDEHSEAIETLEAQYAEHAAALSALRADLAKATAAFAEFEKKDIQHRENLKNMKQRAKKLDEKLAKDTKKREDMAAETAAIEEALPALEAEKASLESRVGAEEEKLEAMLESLKGEMASAGAALEAAQRALSPWEGKIADAKARVDVAVAERDVLVSQKQEAKRKLEEAKQGAEKATAAAEAKTEDIADAEATLVAERARALERREAEAAARAQEAAASAAAREVRGKLEQKRTSADAERSKGVIVSSLMKAKARGELKGVLGRLGDLGAIDAKYDVAVSTACGALDYVVVETTADAQACVAHLRSNNLGVATFLILEKQKALENRMREAKAAAAKEKVTRLMDLIKPADDRVAVAFYYGVRDTAVADDLDAASAIAYDGAKRRRVVTLAGQLIETAGTMSGGGAKPKGGRMRVGDAAPAAEDDAESAAAAIAEAEAELAKSSATAAEARAAATAAMKEAKEAETAVAKLERQLPKLRADVAAAEERAADLSSRLADLEAAAATSKEDAAALKALEKEVAEATAALEAVQRDAAGLRAEVETLQKAMDDVGGDALRAQRATVKSLAEGIAAASEAMLEKRATAASHAKATARVTKSIEEATVERAQLSEDVKATKEAFATLEDEAMTVMETQKATQLLVDEKAGALANVAAARDEASAVVAATKHVEVEIEAKLDDLNALLTETTAKATHWQAELEKTTREQKKQLEEMTALLLGASDAKNAVDATRDVPAPLSPDALNAVNAETQAELVSGLETELAAMKPDMGSIELFATKEAEYSERAEELKTVTESRDATRASYDALRKTRLDEFMSGFNVISLRLKEMYQMITLGGDAELELVDSLDPFSEGIVFSVRPPKKSWKNIANLSGGEKTLSSLALVFALHHYKPTPLYVMDEIDAALDFKNVSIVGHYIKERTKNAQFVIISLRNNMFELADRLVGIYKTNNTTKTVAINPGAFSVGRKKAADAEREGAENVAPAANGAIAA
jgi:structural maintenance of chromosome 4